MLFSPFCFSLSHCIATTYLAKLAGWLLSRPRAIELLKKKCPKSFSRSHLDSTRSIPPRRSCACVLYSYVRRIECVVLYLSYSLEHVHPPVHIYCRHAYMHLYTIRGCIGYTHILLVPLRECLVWKEPKKNLLVSKPGNEEIVVQYRQENAQAKIILTQLLLT